MTDHGTLIHRLNADWPLDHRAADAVSAAVATSHVTDYLARALRRFPALSDPDDGYRVLGSLRHAAAHLATAVDAVSGRVIEHYGSRQVLHDRHRGDSPAASAQAAAAEVSVVVYELRAVRERLARATTALETAWGAFGHLYTDAGDEPEVSS